MLANMAGLDLFLINTGLLTILSVTLAWHDKNKKKREKNKLVERVLSSSNKSWKKVGKVTELYCYPLKSAKAMSLKECYFSEYGISSDNGVSFVEDRMFVAYDVNTKKSVTAGAYRKLLIVKLRLITKNRAKLDVEGMPSLEFHLPNEKSKTVSITMWIGEIVGGIDCGDEPAKWLSKYLCDSSDYNIRLAIRVPGKRRNVTQGPWQSYAKAYERLRNNDSGLFAYLASYMLLSEESVNDLSIRSQKSLPPIQLRPNIVVNGCEPYAEDDWEWIRIGDRAIIRNIKSCTRCTMTTVDPETGIPDPTGEPLKTLRAYRKLKDPLLHKLEFYSPALGIYCGLYRSGDVRIDDDVFVFIMNDEKLIN